MMIKSALKTSLRNLWNNKTTTLLSMGGLIVGITFAISILNYVANERRFDTYVPGVASKYRLTFKIFNDGDLSVNAATSPAPYAELFKSNLSAIEESVRFTVLDDCILRNVKGNKTQKSDKVVLGDPGMLSFFGIEMISGQDNAIDPNTAIISQSLAGQLFGRQDPVGQYVQFNGIKSFRIGGVFHDFPERSTVTANFIGPIDFMQTLRPNYYQEGRNWGGYAFHTYFRLREGTDLESLTADLQRLYYQRFELDEQDLPSEYMGFGLMPVTDIHLHSDLSHEMLPANSATRMALLEYLAYIILVIAWINFLNLQTAKAPERLREIGIRKTLGAATSELLVLFFCEYLILNLLAFGFSWGLSDLLLRSCFFQLLPGAMGQSDIYLPALAIAIIIVGSVVSSGYPAFLTATQGRGDAFLKQKRSQLIRNTLVAFQFGVTIFLVGYTLIIFWQVKFLSNQDPGFDTSTVLSIAGPITQETDIDLKASRFKQRMLSIPGVTEISSASTSPGTNQGWQGNMPSIQGEERHYQRSYLSNITDDFFQVFDLEVLAGAIPKVGTESPLPRVIINERAARGYNWSPTVAIGKKVGYTDEAIVVAVVENFNAVGFQQPIHPMVFIIDHVYKANNRHNYFLLQVATDQLDEIVAASHKTYADIFPENPFEFNLISDAFHKQYEAEKAYNSIFLSFTLLAVVLAISGLIGLTIYHTIQRRKEIGIRKVLGSGELSIVEMFVRNYLKLVLLAAVISIPLLIIFANNWLSGFATRIEPDIYWFVAPAMIMVIVALVTVALVTIKAARLNPVDVLKET